MLRSLRLALRAAAAAALMAPVAAPAATIVTDPCVHYVAGQQTDRGAAPAYMPLRRYTTGTYDYYFQTVRRPDRSQPYARLSILITRTFRPRSAAVRR